MIRTRAFFGALEIIGGIGTAGLGVAIFLRIRSIDVAAGTSPGLKASMPAILMFIAPGVVVLVGSYLQGRYRKQWAFILVLIAGIYNLAYVGGSARFLFLYIGDAVGQFVVWTDLLTVILTLGAGFINMMMSFTRSTE